jgi:hypothetical protein
MMPPRRAPSPAARPTAAEGVTLLPHEVLVHRPSIANIPVFALAIEKGRDETEVRVSTALSAARATVGRKAALALRSGEFGPYQLVYRRQRLATQSVAYSVSVAFATLDDADRFCRTYR